MNVQHFSKKWRRENCIFIIIPAILKEYQIAEQTVTSDPSSLTIELQNVPPLSYGNVGRSEIDAGTYQYVSEESESEAMPPRTACSISYDNSNGTMKITCTDDLFGQLSNDSSLDLNIFKLNGEWLTGGRLLDYELSENKDFIIISDTTLKYSGISIPQDDYEMTLSYRGNGNRKYDLGKITIPEDMNVKKQVPYGVKVDADQNGIYVTCDQTNNANANTCSAYLNHFYETAFKKEEHPSGRNYYYYYSQLELYTKIQGPGGWFPYWWDDTNPLEKIQDSNGLTTRVYVPTSHINKKLHLPAGTTFVRGTLHVMDYSDVDINYNVVLKAGVTVIDVNSIHLTAEQLGEADAWQLKITADHTPEAEKYLSSINGLEMDRHGAGLEKQPPKLEGDKYVLLVPATNLISSFAIDENEAGKEKKDLILSTDDQYANVTIPCKLSKDNPFRTMPENVQISVVGDGFRIAVLSDKDNGLLDVLDKEKYPKAFEGYTKIYGTIEDKKVPNGDGNAFYKYYDAKKWNIQNDPNDPTKRYVLVSADYDELGLDKDRDLNKSYYFRLIDSYYGMTGLSNYSQSINPLILAQAARSGDPESAVAADSKFDALKKLDGYSITTDGNSGEFNGGLKNVKVSTSKTGEAKDIVDIDGAVAASLTTSNKRNQDGTVEPDLTDINYAYSANSSDQSADSSNSKVSITVNQKIDKLDESTAQGIVSRRVDSSSLTATDVGFNVTLSKSYENVKRGDVSVSELPYEAALVFDLPSEDLASDEKYVVLREHNRQVDEIPVEVLSDGKAVAYTDRFSSFVLAKKKISSNESKSSSKVSSAAGYDDGSPFTRDARGNVYDRWGNKIWANADGSVTRKDVPATGICE
ncbi:MAG: hypothetical protein PUE98_07900 [Galactobacillus timonensis]|uniref:hypothetical protein n=1 Tax=Galactobacillus timonensis TaxID=2041840 RepID=UPI00240A34BA|nr:hypothetical protein [Galactobacillus timonensis]MDD6600371.1 hypothetical protein [Galactobacillus timonensis]